MLFILLLNALLISGSIGNDIPTQSLKDAYALLVAGSNGIYNYRHQADVAHAYHLLLAKGMPESHIVVMAYDDIAWNPSNPQIGTVKNLINGPNLYPGLNIDYRGDDVNIYNFRDVLIGKADSVRGKGTGRVIQSTKNDKVFVFYADHGGVGFVCMPTGPLLYRSFLHDAIRQAKFSDMVVYIEACESGSMFDEIDKIPNVYGLSASTSDESSWATQCSNGTCYADEFSLNWMQDSEQYNLRQHHVETQFQDVRTATKKSTVCQFGSSTLSDNFVSDYQGAKVTGGKVDGNSAEMFEAAVNLGFSIPARDVPVFYFQTQAVNGKTEEERKSASEELKKIYANRIIGREYLFWLSDEVSKNLKEVHTQKSTEAILDCYESVLMQLEKNCIEFSSTPYITSMVSVFKKLAEHYECGEIHSRIQAICEKKEMLKNIL